MENTFVVIMAGGIGSRFWPFSTSEKPKQFLDILGIGKSLIRMTFERFADDVPLNRIYVLTNANYANLVQEELPELQTTQILLEPMMKNTAPCVLYAALKINALNSDAKLLVVPSDHLILQKDLFLSNIKTALKEAENDVLVTIGIQPTRPDTGYGYIQFDNSESSEDVKSVVQFREKPNLELAQEFLASGNFVWNAGIFVWSTKALLKAFQMHKKGLFDIFSKDLEQYNTSGEQEFIDSCFQACESISIDYAILEPSSNVRVVSAKFDWSDLGTWGSVFTHIDKDDHGNGTIGKILALESRDNMIRISENKEAVIVGLDNFIIIEANDKLLIAPMQKEQQIKEWVTNLGKI